MLIRGRDTEIIMTQNTFLDNSTGQNNAFTSLIYFLVLSILFTAIQAGFLYLTISPKIGIINTFPTFIFVFIWLTFSHVFYKHKIWQWTIFFLGFALTLRLPITVNRSLELLNWLLYIGLYISVFIPIGKYFLNKKRSIILLVTVVLILFNSFSHIYLNSPFTYAFRLLNNLSSNYTPGQDNNSTWECPYEKPYIVVQCDMRHFIAPEKIFTEPNYDGSFSVFLRRFFYGYLSSLIGFPGNRWISSFSINIFFWLLSSVAIYRTCILLGLNEQIASTSMLCLASSWGFVSFVAQPAPYLTAYAFSTIVPWASLEITQTPKITSKTFFCIATIVSGLLVYDIYPVTITGLLLICWHKQFRLAASTFLIQCLYLWSWTNIGLAKVLGTVGNLRNTQVITNSFSAWLLAIGKYDLIFKYIGLGTFSFVIAGFWIGVPAIIILLCYLQFYPNSNKSDIWSSEISNDDSYFCVNRMKFFLISISLLMLISSIFLTPEAIYWNGTFGMLPRFNYYFLPAFTIALATISYQLKIGYLIPILAFFVACIDFTGIASVALMFDYGGLKIIQK